MRCEICERLRKSDAIAQFSVTARDLTLKAEAPASEHRAAAAAQIEARRVMDLAELELQRHLTSHRLNGKSGSQPG
jgi:hypothetical protein